MFRLSSLFILPWVLTILLTATPLAAEVPQEVDQNLQKRVLQYWEATQVTDWATTYRLESRSRQKTDPQDPLNYFKERLSRQGTGRYQTIKVDKIEQTGDAAVVKLIAVEIKPLAGKAFKHPRFIESRWERVDGDWYHVAWQTYIPDDLRKSIQERQEAAKAAAEAACREAPETCPKEPEEAAPISPVDQAAAAEPGVESLKGQ